MAELDGDFVLNGRTFHYQILETQDFQGRDWKDVEGIEDHIQETDMIFYVASVEDESGEITEYYRWLGGPFISIEDVEAAIADETDTYESAA
jgi:hypothetical protein